MRSPTLNPKPDTLNRKPLTVRADRACAAAPSSRGCLSYLSVLAGPGHSCQVRDGRPRTLLQTRSDLGLRVSDLRNNSKANLSDFVNGGWRKSLKSQNSAERGQTAGWHPYSCRGTVEPETLHDMGNSPNRRPPAMYPKCYHPVGVGGGGGGGGVLI